MRTTITLEPDVARAVEDAMHRERRSFKDVVNSALRRALMLGGVAEAAVAPYRVASFETQLRPGFDAGSLNRLVDELEDEAVLRVASKVDPAAPLSGRSTGR